jgi:predicted nucleic acid-binding protein
VRRRYIGELCRQFQELLDQYESFEISLTAGVREAAITYMTEYNLGPHDAVHLASALSAGVVDLASFDRGFRKVERLYLWNDRIFSAEETE